MDVREERGIAIAKAARIVKRGHFYLVPSQSGGQKYEVYPSETRPFCNCPDHEVRGVRCKHIFAVLHTIKSQKNSDGSETVVQTLTVTETKKPSYPQNWAAYNASQTNEKAKFQMLLHDLCSRVSELPRKKTGRQRLPIADVIFSAAFKVYSTFSARRFMSDLREAHAKGYISKLPCYNSIFTYLEMPELTPILKSLVAIAARPLKAIETCFAGDSTAFSTSRFARWFDTKWGVERKKADWVKCHLVCGVKTQIVTAVEISNSADGPAMPALVRETAEQFDVKEVCLDKAYSGIENLQTIVDVGGMPYVPFRSNATGGIGGLFEKMFHYFNYKREEFLQHYHQRSNVESCYSMIKAKFRDHVRSKTDVSCANEALLKVLDHNICVTIQSMYELGIEPTFYGDKLDKQATDAMIQIPQVF